MPNQIIDYLLKITLALITLGLGFSVGKDNLIAALMTPRSIVLGLVSQMILLPILAYFICSIFSLSDTFILGVLIISFCPGGSTANLISFLLKANVGLSICLSFFNGFLCLLSVPLFLNVSKYILGINSFDFQIPYEVIIKDLLVLIIIPTTIGIYLSHRFKTFVNTVKGVLKYLLPILLAFVFGFKFFANSSNGGLDISVSDTKQLLLPLLAVNLLSMLIGYIFSRINKVGVKDSLTISIETGLQNTALALLIASTISNIEVQKPAVIYASFSFITTFLIAWCIKKGLVVNNKTF